MRAYASSHLVQLPLSVILGSVWYPCLGRVWHGDHLERSRGGREEQPVGQLTAGSLWIWPGEKEDWHSRERHGARTGKDCTARGSCCSPGSRVRCSLTFAPEVIAVVVGEVGIGVDCTGRMEGLHAMALVVVADRGDDWTGT